MFNNIKICIITVVMFCMSSLCAQVGVSVSPPRVYYEVAPGQTGSNEILVTNVSNKNTLELSITLGDWMYNEYGENLVFPPDTLQNSCASWINISGASYLSLKPQESKTIKVNMTVPQDLNDSVTVHTAMLYITQMNPVNDVDEKGANIKVSVRSGIKLFHRKPIPRDRKININNLSWRKSNNEIQLEFKNEGNVWIEGTVKSYLFDKSTGKEITLDNISFYTMPEDNRILRIPVPNSIKSGSYIATVLVDYGDKNNIEAAELQFIYE